MPKAKRKEEARTGRWEGTKQITVAKQKCPERASTCQEPRPIARPYKTPSTVSTTAAAATVAAVLTSASAHAVEPKVFGKLVNHCLPGPVSGGSSDALRVGFLFFLLPFQLCCLSSAAERFLARNPAPSM